MGYIKYNKYLSYMMCKMCLFVQVSLDCLRFGSNGLALLKPEDGGGLGQLEVFPDDDNDDENDYDDENEEDDENDDDDDDDDDLF